MKKSKTQLHVVYAADSEWSDHPRFAGIKMKPLLTPADNALANVNLVHVPSGSAVGHHVHAAEVETVYLLSGQAILTIGDNEALMTAGCIVAIPSGAEHTLRNVGSESVELIAFFTPPIL
jgi:quercetin dioxygenase-like cupin family protein